MWPWLCLMCFRPCSHYTCCYFQLLRLLAVLPQPPFLPLLNSPKLVCLALTFAVVFSTQNAKCNCARTWPGAWLPHLARLRYGSHSPVSLFLWSIQCAALCPEQHIMEYNTAFIWFTCETAVMHAMCLALPQSSPLYCIYMPEFQLNMHQLNILRHSSYHSTKLGIGIELNRNGL